MSLKATIKDIAKATNLSTATVSRVLSHKDGSYKASTAKLVRDTARKLGYHRNAAAADLSSNTIRTIAVIINNTHTNFFQPILDGIQSAAVKQHRQIIIFYAGNNDEKLLTQAISAALERRLAGMLLVSTKVNQAQLDLLNASQVPYRFVSIKNPHDQQQLFISSDNVHIGEVATNYLIQHDHRKIALAGLDRSSTGEERLLGYQKAMTAANLAIDPNLIIYGDYSFDNGQKLLPAIQKAQATAVIAASDMVGAGIIKAANQAHLHLPDDLSIICIDGTFVCQITDPQLTSVTQDFFQMGVESLESLSDQKTAIYVPVKINERDSVTDL